ncbi:MAG: hypothetical protein C0469_15460 [Cyanobacteria bacterium DS2.3.42]|nr:hypothetical protein [Cyanobacteria bacterium DS2.3.42]
MQSKLAYLMMAGLAAGILSTASPKAVAGDNAYFAVLAPKQAIPMRLDTLSRTIETTTSFPVVVGSGKMTTVIEGATLIPVMLERTSVAKPHKWPFSFGVWN